MTRDEPAPVDAWENPLLAVCAHCGRRNIGIDDAPQPPMGRCYECHNMLKRHPKLPFTERRGSLARRPKR